MKESQFKAWWIALLLITVGIYIIGLFAPIMDVDAAQYAAISREMYLHHDYLQTHCSNQNYLDKPPLLFWLSVISFHIFGIHTWSYKLPSVLFTLIGLYATYKLAERLYNKQIGRSASLILATCQAFFLFNTDVRTDTILTAAIIVSIWQLYEFIETKKWVNALFGFSFVALGMLAKGPLGVCVPTLALASQLAYQRRWKVFLWPAWWVGLVYALLLLSPMVYGLYEQYGWKGPRFFFWDQSFGRITGANEWHNNAGYFFFVHTFLWAFLPWTFFPLFSLWDKIRLLIKTKFKYYPTAEVLTYCGFIFTFIALSFSHYKLPHYIFNVFPLVAIFSAASFEEILTRYKWLVIAQKIVLLIALLIILYLIGYLFPMTSVFTWIVVVLLIFACSYFVFNTTVAPLPSLLFGSAACILAVNLGMNAHFYPTILTYQSGSNLGNYVSEHNIPPEQVYDFNYSSYSEDFYAGAWITTLHADSIIIKCKTSNQHFYIVGRNELLQLLNTNTIPYTIVNQTPDYPVTLLKLKFLSPSTRNSTVDTIYMVKTM